MKINELKRKLNKNRPMTTINLRMPQDVVEDLQRVALRLGFSGYEALIRAYVGQGLRTDLARLESSLEIPILIENLRKYGIEEAIIANVISESTNLSHMVTA